ncbi:DoxX family protein [Nitratireductor mangrovi]|uniref:DoxX family protein n=1 Tax=Nitratireductor mangrovi TaxID=2599600 RepID=A0A5B8L2Q7_9HYPH|nr:DoxX family protein [Nitratireductor mangrovi]QDZ02099.1 DoxX family protein [Nitratireductor mangrovi]
MSNSVILLLARILLAIIFIMSGLQKFGGIEGTAGYISSVGLPAATLLAWLAAIFETVVGIALLVGFQTRIAAIALALFCVFTGFMFHYVPADQIQMILFMKNITIAGGLLALFASGPGSLSVDARTGAVATA